MRKRAAKYDQMRDEVYAREKMAPRDVELAEAAYRHFPEVARRIIDIEATARDELIRTYLEETQTRIWRRKGRNASFEVRYGQGPPKTSQLSRLAAAISARDSWQFRKSWDAISKEEQRKIRTHIELRWLARGGDGSYVSAFGSPFLMAELRFFAEDDQFWTVAVDAINRRKRAASFQRRPQNLCRDRLALELAIMWSQLASRPIVVPHADIGASDLTGAMITFVRDAARVYPEVTISFNSTSSWTRILHPYLSQ